LYVLAAVFREVIHPRRLAIHMRNHRAAARLQDAVDFTDRARCIASVVDDPARPYAVERVIREGEGEDVLGLDGFRPVALQLEVAFRNVDCRLGEISDGHAYATLQELERIESHSGTDFEDVLALQQFGLLVDAGHDLWKLVGVHPGSDMVEGLFRSNGEVLRLDILQAESVAFPICLDSRDILTRCQCHLRLPSYVENRSRLRRNRTRCVAANPSTSFSNACGVAVPGAQLVRPHRSGAVRAEVFP